jgi:N-acetylmuramic acid 6-phosphate etherase
MSQKVYSELLNLSTEEINLRSRDLDLMTPLEIVRVINAEDKTVASAVEKALPRVAQAAEMIAKSFSQGGRLIYAGAGTSGRLGVLDSAECPPTFGVSAEKVVGIIAGGPEALVRSIEGAEDDEMAGIRAIAELKVNSKDTVCGLSASRRTPFVLAVLKEAKRLGAWTIFLCCNPIPPEVVADVIINPLTGPEILTGSTRLKAGTATKMVLNMLSTTAMVLSGKTYGNLMVDLKPLSEKLRARSRLILSNIFNLDYEAADKLLNDAGGELKLAITMKLYNFNSNEAKEYLIRTGGRIRSPQL